jgi:hypothetical protein
MLGVIPLTGKLATEPFPCADPLPLNSASYCPPATESFLDDFGLYGFTVLASLGSERTLGKMGVG